MKLTLGLINLKHEWGQSGKPTKPLLKAPKGDKQLGVADFFRLGTRTASEKKAAEWDAAAKKRKPCTILDGGS